LYILKEKLNLNKRKNIMVILLVVITLIIAISIEMIIVKSRKPAVETSASALPVFNKSSLHAPEGYLFSGFHTWVHQEEKTAKVGIDNFAVKALGNILIKNIASEGKNVKIGDTVIEAEVHGQKVNFRSPVSGTIKSVNKLLFNRPVKDAYGDDWSLEIQKDETEENLMLGQQAFLWLKKELRRYKDFLTENSLTPEAVGVTMYDGGNIVEGVLSSLNQDVIKDFEEQFLSGQKYV
jgi:glycine cleavage system H protein